ncbi:MAG TPA: sterol desaturase family protein, partial [Caldithrix abyssi]|nr:sterol desaturase family protein [Caldithrix abyssi]
MDSIIHFFEQIPSSQRTIILVSGFTFFWILENSLPLFAFKYNKWQHALLNIFFTLTTLLVNLGFAFVIISAADYTSQHQSGLLYLLPLPLWLHVVLGVLLLDFIGAWLIHWVEHRVPFMWRFHIIHHTDTKVDVTTALRHHPGESVFRAAFTILAIFVAGVPVGVVMLYQTLSALFAQLTHANMRMPRQLD